MGTQTSWKGLDQQLSHKETAMAEEAHVHGDVPDATPERSFYMWRKICRLKPLHILFLLTCFCSQQKSLELTQGVKRM